VIAVPPAIVRPASVPSASQRAFCAAWGRFGDNPTFGTLTVAHNAAKHAPSHLRSLYGRFESVLVAGYPVNTIRNASDAVWKVCQP
jgi:hypothetical protein